MSLDPKIINTQITNTATKNLHHQQNLYAEKYPKIKYVILSPVRRVIETFEAAFGGHPNFKNMKVYLMDELRESIGSTSSIAPWSPEEIKSLNRSQFYDFSFKNKYSYPEMWFLYSMTPQLQKQATEILKNCET